MPQISAIIVADDRLLSGQRVSGGQMNDPFSQTPNRDDDEVTSESSAVAGNQDAIAGGGMTRRFKGKQIFAGFSLLVASGTLCVNAQINLIHQFGRFQPGDSMEADLLGAENRPDVLSRHLPPPDAEAENMRSTTLVVERGDTLQKMIRRGGASAAEAENAVTAIRAYFDPRKLQINQEISLTLESQQLPLAAAGYPHGATADNPPMRLSHLTIQTDVDRFVSVKRQQDGRFSAEEIITELLRRPTLAKGTINANLFTAARKAGASADTVVELIRLFSFDVDFQRDIREGDAFEILFDQELDYNGEVARAGPIRYASLTLSGQRRELFRFQPPGDPDADYFDENGKTARKALMKTPIDGARLSSGFGPRKHPILGYTRMHKGTDFAAPRGTPIMAAGNGTIEIAGRNGGYGNYIRIRHNGQYKTAYAHLSKFASGIRTGARVRQGQTIGYVGSTGRSTGPHLHYEVHFNGKQVNSRALKLPTGRSLQNSALAAFQQSREKIEQERIAMNGDPVQTADAK